MIGKEKISRREVDSCSCHGVWKSVQSENFPFPEMRFLSSFSCHEMQMEEFSQRKSAIRVTHVSAQACPVAGIECLRAAKRETAKRSTFQRFR